MAHPTTSTLTRSTAALTRSTATLRAGETALLVAELLVGAQLVLLALTSDVSAVARLVGVSLALATTAFLVRVSRGGRALRRGLALVAVGSLGIVADGGVGPVWLATNGVSAVAVVATSALVAGAALLIAGAWAILRALHGWWRLLVIPGAFLLVQFVLLPGAGAVYGTHPPRTPTGGEMAAAASTVRLETTDGVTLVSWYTPSRNGAALVILPGSGGAKGSANDHAAALARHGYGILALDSRGTGDSGGIGNAWGWHGDRDIDAAIDWLATRGDVEPGRIAVLGLSMGGEEAITAAATDDRISAVVAEGVSARVPEDLAYLPADPTGIIQLLEGRVMWTLAGLMTDAAPPPPLREALGAASRTARVLLIVGGDRDEALAAPLLVASAPLAEVWRLPDTPHIQALARHPEEWERRVVGFLDEALAS